MVNLKEAVFARLEVSHRGHVRVKLKVCEVRVLITSVPLVPDGLYGYRRGSDFVYQIKKAQGWEGQEQ